MGAMATQEPFERTSEITQLPSIVKASGSVEDPASRNKVGGPTTAKEVYMSLRKPSSRLMVESTSKLEKKIKGRKIVFKPNQVKDE